MNGPRCSSGLGSSARDPFAPEIARRTIDYIFDTDEPRVYALAMVTSAGPQEATARVDTQRVVQPVPKPRQLRPIVVPLSLDELHGPSAGLVVPPRRLWWSGEEDAVFDLDNRVHAAELYEAIFDTARTAKDFADHLDAGLLIELWSDLGMRRATRQAWEAAHPVLATSAASGNAA
jgi:hypothetical protein